MCRHPSGDSIYFSDSDLVLCHYMLGLHIDTVSCVIVKNKRWRLWKGQSKMDIPEKLTTIRRKTKHTMCWTPLFANKQLEVKTSRTSFLCGNRN